MILIVEDEALIGFALRLLLNLAGHHVRGPATCAARAREIAAEETPVIALVDVNLGDEVDGLQVARELHRQYGTTIIFLTAEPDRTAVAHDIALGVITKPYNLQTPVRAVELAADARAGRLLTNVPPDLELFA